MPKGIKKDGTKLGFKSGHVKSGGWVLEEKVCRLCGKMFTPTQPNQIYCGSKTKKEGCSYIKSLEQRRKWNKTEIGKLYQKEYQKKWRKLQRILNTPYYKRQLKLTKTVSKEKKSLYSSVYRKNNLDHIIYKNKLRKISKGGAVGSFTYQEWEDKKISYENRCAKCGTHQDELENKYGKHFKNLTVDHIIPLSRGGTNYIDNIVPLCVGCNSKKKDKMPIIGYVGATMDMLHTGHINLMERAKSMCDYLVVVLNTDEFVERFKGRKPIMPLQERINVIKNLWMVDEVGINESGEDSKPMLLKYKPNLIFVGDDYNFESYCKQMDFTKEWLDENNIQIIFLPRTPDISSTLLRQNVK